MALSAARSPRRRKVDVTGKWAFNVETSAGAGAPTFTFKQDGEKLTGHYTGHASARPISTGTVKGAGHHLPVQPSTPRAPRSRAPTPAPSDKDTMKGKLVIEWLGEGTFHGEADNDAGQVRSAFGRSVFAVRRVAFGRSRCASRRGSADRVRAGASTPPRSISDSCASCHDAPTGRTPSKGRAEGSDARRRSSTR